MFLKCSASCSYKKGSYKQCTCKHTLTGVKAEVGKRGRELGERGEDRRMTHFLHDSYVLPAINGNGHKLNKTHMPTKNKRQANFISSFITTLYNFNA